MCLITKEIGADQRANMVKSKLFGWHGSFVISRFSSVIQQQAGTATNNQAHQLDNCFKLNATRVVSTIPVQSINETCGC